MSPAPTPAPGFEPKAIMSADQFEKDLTQMKKRQMKSLQAAIQAIIKRNSSRAATLFHFQRLLFFTPILAIEIWLVATWMS